MAVDFWLSFGLGAGLGVAYGAAGYLTNRRAAGSDAKRFFLYLFGGLTVRLFAALTLLLILLTAAPVRAGVLVGSFGAVFAAALVLEVWRLHRR